MPLSVSSSLSNQIKVELSGLTGHTMRGASGTIQRRTGIISTTWGAIDEQPKVRLGEEFSAINLRQTAGSSAGNRTRHLKIHRPAFCFGAFGVRPVGVGIGSIVSLQQRRATAAAAPRLAAPAFAMPTAVPCAAASRATRATATCAGRWTSARRSKTATLTPSACSTGAATAASATTDTAATGRSANPAMTHRTRVRGLARRLPAAMRGCSMSACSYWQRENDRKVS